MAPSASSPAFTYPPSLDALNITQSEFLSKNPHYATLMAASIVFRQPPPPPAPPAQRPQILLLRRAPTDSWPLLWEVPGGRVDQEDESVMHGAARELAEEAGLSARAFVATVGVAPAPASPEKGGIKTAQAEADAVSDKMVGPLLTWLDFGKVWAKVTFLAEVDSTEDVKLREDEHVEWMWVTEQEALDCRSESGAVINFTAESVRRTVLEGFRLRRRLEKGEGVA